MARLDLRERVVASVKHDPRPPPNAHRLTGALADIFDTPIGSDFAEFFIVGCPAVVSLGHSCRRRR